MKYTRRLLSENVREFEVKDDVLVELRSLNPESKKDNGHFIYCNDKYVDDFVEGVFIYKGKAVYTTKHEPSRTIDNNIDISGRLMRLFGSVGIFEENINIKKLTQTVSLRRLGDFELLYNLGEFSIYTGYFIEDKILIRFDVKSGIFLYCLNIETKEEWKWSIFSLGKEDQKIKRIIGISNDVVYLASQGDDIGAARGGMIYFVGLDVNTGKKVFELSELKGFGMEYAPYVQNRLPPNSDCFIISEDGNELIGFFAKHLIIINVKSKDYKSYDFSDYFKLNDIKFFNPISRVKYIRPIDGYICITGIASMDEFPDVFLNCLILLNVITKEIEWHYIFTDTGIGTNIPILDNGNIYIKCLKTNLYVFEKEEKV